MQKVDFTAEAEDGKPFKDVKVGQKLGLVQQTDGSWACSRVAKPGGSSDDTGVLCPVPPAAAASIAQHHGTAAAAAIRSVKRCQDDPGAATSMQIRITFSTPGTLADCCSAVFDASRQHHALLTALLLFQGRRPGCSKPLPQLTTRPASLSPPQSWSS